MHTTIPTCIVCPTCGAAIDWAPGNPAHAVVCTNAHTFPVHGGVIDLLGAPRPQSIAAWSNEWRITAWAYERLWRPRSLSILSGQPFPYSRELPAVAAAIPSDARIILDLACSNGLYARTAAQQHPQATVIGIDRSLPMLIDAQRRATVAQLAITYVRADARALPLATASVDCTLIGGSLNEMEDLPRIWAEVARISTPAATFYSMHLLRTSAHSPRLLGLGGITLFGTDDIPTALTHAGWALIDRQQTGIVQTIRALRRS